MAAETQTLAWTTTNNLDLELWSPSGGRVAPAAATTAKPEQISYTVPATATGAYTLRTRPDGRDPRRPSVHTMTFAVRCLGRVIHRVDGVIDEWMRSEPAIEPTTMDERLAAEPYRLAGSCQRVKLYVRRPCERNIPRLTPL